MITISRRQDISRIAIVGAGPAGLFAALSAAEECARTGYKCAIDLYEADDRIGRTILVTGNGRCNFSNAHIKSDNYFHPDFVSKVFLAADEALGADYVLSTFKKMGLVWREEAEGRLYPLANKASVIVDLLRASLKRYGIAVHTSSPLVKIDAPSTASPSFTLFKKNKELVRADAVILAIGGRDLAFEHMDTMHIHRYRPSLGPLRVEKSHIPLVRELDNIRLKCSLSLNRMDHGLSRVIAEERGEVQFRKYGISGICTFNMSRHALPGDSISIHILSCSDEDEATAFLQDRFSEMKTYYGDSLDVYQFLSGLILPRIIDALCAYYAIDAQAQMTFGLCKKLALVLHNIELPLSGIGDKELCQIKRGGVDVGCLDAQTMQSLSYPGFFAVGEAVDVDGPCGGYNLHWAWTSGALAGNSAIHFLAQK